MAISDRMKKVRVKKEVLPPDYGVLGEPINRTHPFYFGFLATIGGLVAILLMRSLAAASQTFVLIIIALFLAMGLNPAVEILRRRGLTRTKAVTAIFFFVIVFVGLFAALLIPPVVSQGADLINHAPTLLDQLKNNSTIASLNDHYGLVDTLQQKLKSITSDGTLIISAFGGVVGVGKTLLSGTFTILTILVLTLYFVTSLPKMIELGIRLVPATRRDRVGRLTNEIVAQVGAFVGSQIVVSMLASIFVLALSLIIGLPSPFAIAMVILVCGLIPLIGHFIGCSIVTIIALTQSISTGLIAFVAYVLYVQIENYIITPKIMRKSLSVPGAVTIIAALLGSSLLGLIGALLAVPLAAAVILILEEVVYPRADNN
ncbi:MAG: AI-2E family transporter [Actinobacteria bacterium]|nr:AI-2E family transporter [Actinomycetota bacterium]